MRKIIPCIIAAILFAACSQDESMLVSDSEDQMNLSIRSEADAVSIATAFFESKECSSPI